MPLDTARTAGSGLLRKRSASSRRCASSSGAHVPTPPAASSAAPLLPRYFTNCRHAFSANSSRRPASPASALIVVGHDALGGDGLPDLDTGDTIAPREQHRERNRQEQRPCPPS